MADLTSVIELIFQGTDRVSETVRSVSGNLGQLGAATTAVAQPFAQLGDFILKTDAALLGLATVIGVKSVAEASKFEAALLDLQKQMNEGEGDAAAYAGQLEALAVRYGVNANELVKSAADFKAAGYTIDESIQLVDQSLKLMIAGGVSASQATTILNSSLAGFQVPADQTATAAQRIGDVLNKVADISKSGFTDLAQGFSDLAPIAKLTGLSFEEVAATLSVVIDKGISGSEAATGLKSTFLSLVAPSKEAQTAMAALGIQFDAAGKPMGSVKDILTGMIPQWDRLTDTQKLNAAATIAGKDQAAKFVALLDDWKLAMDRVKIANEEAGGSIDKEVTIRLKSAEVQFASLSEATRQLAVALGSQLLASTGTAAGGLSALAQAFKGVIDSGALSPLLDLVNAQGDRLGELLKTIAKNLPAAFERLDFSGLVDAFQDLGAGLERFFAALFGDLDLTTVEGLAEALQQVVDGAELLVRATEGMIQAFEPFAAAVRAAIENFSALDEASQVDFGEFLGTMQAIVAAGPGIAAALIAIGKAGLDMGTALDVVFGGAKIIVNAFQVAFDTAVLAIIETAKFLPTQLLQVAEALGAEGMAADLRKALAGLNEYGNAVRENLDRNAQELKDGWAQATGAAGASTSEFGTRLDGVRARLDSFKTGAESANEGLKQQVTAADGAMNALRQYEASMGIVVQANVKLGEASAKAGTDVYALSDKIKVTAGGLQAGGDGANQYSAALDGVVKSYDQIGGGTVKATGAFKAVSESVNETAKSAEEATKKSDEFLVKMEEIASNERIKIIEATVSLKTEQFKADAERVKATFASLDNTITSTGDLLGSLFGNLAGTSDRWTQLELTEQIDLENKRRQEALDMQKKLAEAEINRINAQADALNRGDALIQIDGTGLAPQLEAFMWEILKAIRVRANAEFSDYLLGMAAP